MAKIKVYNDTTKAWELVDCGNAETLGGKAPDQFAPNTLASKTAIGLMPQLPNESLTTKYLRQDGTWAVPPDTKPGTINTTATTTQTTSSSESLGGAIVLHKISKTGRYSDLIGLPVNATVSVSGLMSSNDKAKLDTIANGANNTVIANNLTTTVSGSALDATQGKILKESIEARITPTGTIVANRVAVFSDTTGKVIKDSGFTIACSVPANAKFTDTTYSVATTSATGLMSSADKVKLDGIQTGATNYTHPSTHPYSMITGAPASLPANGGNADTVDGKHASDFALLNSQPRFSTISLGASGAYPYLYTEGNDLNLRGGNNGSFHYLGIKSGGVTIDNRNILSEIDALKSASTSPIKSIQRGTVSGTTEITVTINAINTAKAFIIGQPGYAYNSSSSRTYGASIVNSTTIKVVCGAGSATWEVIEFI